MRILVVEDEIVVAEMIRRALERLGNACVVAASTERADAELSCQAVDALTLDLTLPGTPGLEWLEELAAFRPDLARRTLVVTGRTPEAEVAERVAACGAGLLIKPFTLESLADAVRSQLAVGRD